jgi:general secretion pathway protein G
MRTQQNANANFSGNRVVQVMATAGPKRSKATNDNSGFTLVELIVTMGIIAILISLAIPSYSNIRNLAKVSRAESEIRTIDTDINAYIIDKNTLPVHLSDIGPDGSLLDPWGHPYQYNSTPTYLNFAGELVNDDYDLYSLGADGASAQNLNQSNCLDDIIRAGNGSSVVLGEQY